MAQDEHFDVAIIGGGSGLTTAHYAVEDDKRVALIDSQPDALGGTCVNRGCIPTKGLVHSANVMSAVRGAGEFGIQLDQGSVRADFGAIMERERRRREKNSGGVREWVEDAMTPIYGRARFVGERALEVEGRRVTADTVFVASGARPAVPPIDGLEDVPYLTNESALELEEMPESLVIIGGGYIGCEFGHFFERMGARVTIIHPDEKRLLSEDDEIGDVFTRAFGERVTLELGARAVGVERAGDGVRVSFERGDKKGHVEAQAVMVAAGRAPNTDGLGLEAAGVGIDEDGWIRVDEHLRTKAEGVYAYGDCIGQGMFKHTSSYEGKLAYDNSRGESRSVDYRANPHAVFAEPEIASVGLTEGQCRERGLEYRCATHPYGGIAKGQIFGDPPGLAKAIVEDGPGKKILGFHLAGPHAAMLVHEVVVAMSLGLGAGAINDAIHVHPAMPELVAEVFGKL